MTENTTPTPTADNIQPGQVDSINAADMAHGELTADPAQQDERKAAEIAINKARTKRKTTTSAAVKSKYNNKAYDSLQVFISKGGKDAVKAAAAAAGMSMAGYITAAVNAYAGTEIIPPLDINPYI